MSIDKMTLIRERVRQSRDQREAQAS
jgi:hypothetical protein